MKRIDETVLKSAYRWISDKGKWTNGYQSIPKILEVQSPKHEGTSGFIRMLAELPHIHLSDSDRLKVVDFAFEFAPEHEEGFVRCDVDGDERMDIPNKMNEWIYDGAVFSYYHSDNLFWMAYFITHQEDVEVDAPLAELLTEEKPIGTFFFGIPIQDFAGLTHMFWPLIYYHDPESTSKDGYRTTSLMNWENADEEDISKGFEDSCRDLNEKSSDVLAMMSMLHVYLKHSDRHAVEVVPTKPKKYSKTLHDKRPWSAPSGPKVLLLDRIPTAGNSTGTGSPKKSHMRRGHWRTLNHPRYRHHPQYQQKIWVKPSFIGPEQGTYQGNYYRLVQPVEEMLDVA